jgi:hypothetical protein
MLTNRAEHLVLARRASTACIMTTGTCRTRTCRTETTASWTARSPRRAFTLMPALNSLHTSLLFVQLQRTLPARQCVPLRRLTPTLSGGASLLLLHRDI